MTAEPIAILSVLAGREINHCVGTVQVRFGSTNQELSEWVQEVHACNKQVWDSDLCAEHAHGRATDVYL